MRPRHVALPLGLMAVLLFAAPPSSASDESKAVIRVLIEKGFITVDELEAAKEEIATESLATAPPTSTEHRTFGDRLATFDRAIEDNSVVHVGSGTLKLGGLFQLWGEYNGGAHHRFRVRRTELAFEGDMLGDGRFKYFILLDPVAVQEDTGRLSILQDAVMTLDKLPGIPNHKIDIGQMKLPITEEGLRPSPLLDTMERSVIGRTFGDQRDIGVQLTGDWPCLTYQLGVFNGSGQNEADVDNLKDVAGRVVVRPLKFLEFLGMGETQGKIEAGVSGYSRPSRRMLKKKRLGYEGRFEYKNLSAKAEYMWGQGTVGSSVAGENAIKAKGWYGQLAYMLDPWVPELQLVAKYENWDPDRSAGDDMEHIMTVGFNYFADKFHVKWHLNFVHITEQGPKSTNDQVLAGLQYAF